MAICSPVISGLLAAGGAVLLYAVARTPGELALVALLVMASPISRAGVVRGRHLPMGVGLWVAGLGLLLLGGWPRFETVLASMAIYGLGFGLIFPAANARVADATHPGERGTAFGLFYAFHSVGVVLGAPASGLIAGRAWAPTAGPFLLAGLLAASCGVAILIAGPAPDPSPQRRANPRPKPR